MVLLLALAIILISSAVQGSVGFGANVLSIPSLLLLEPALVPGPAMMAGAAINLLMMLRDRRSTSVRPISNALIGRLGGTILAVGALSVLSDDGLALLVAVTVLAIVAVSLSGLSPTRTTRNLVTAGTISGFSASTAGIGGPPVALLFQGASGPEVRGSLGAFFVIGNIMSLTGLAIAGRFGAEEIRLGLLLTPAALAGFGTTRWILPIVDRGYTKPAILGLSSLAAVGVLARLLLDGS